MRKEDTKRRLQTRAKTSPIERKTHKNYSLLIELLDDELQDLGPLTTIPPMQS